MQCHFHPADGGYKIEKDEERIFCDCCFGERKEVMAVRRGDKLIITDRRHGQRHICVIALTSKAQSANVKSTK